MTFGPVASVTVFSHGLLRDQTVPLSRFLVLTGENDSGKTTALAALEHILSGQGDGQDGRARGAWQPSKKLLDDHPPSHRWQEWGQVIAEIAGAELCEPRLLVTHARGSDELVLAVRHQEGIVDGRKLAEFFPPGWVPPAFKAPVKVVQLGTGGGDDLSDVVLRYLADMWKRLSRAPVHQGERRWTVETPEGEELVEHSLGTAPKTPLWVDQALAGLRERAWRELPRFVRSVYDAVVVVPDLTLPFDPSQPRFKVGLRDPEADRAEPAFWVGELAAGMRTYLGLAVREAARVLQDRGLLLRQHREPGPKPCAHASDEDRPLLDVDTFDWMDTPAPSDAAGEITQVLYLIDEPEIHLHPLAQDEVARWLLGKTEDEQVGVAVATHSPAFIDLPIDKVQFVRCERTAEDARSRSAARLFELPPDRSRLVDELAGKGGYRRHDLLLRGRVPLLVEGKHDQRYVDAAFWAIYHREPAQVGLNVLPVDGIDNFLAKYQQVVTGMYPSWAPVFILHDRPNPSQKGNLDKLARHKGHERLVLCALDVDDISLAFPIELVRGLACAGPEFPDWKTLEARAWELAGPNAGAPAWKKAIAKQVGERGYERYLDQACDALRASRACVVDKKIRDLLLDIGSWLEIERVSPAEEPGQDRRDA